MSIIFVSHQVRDYAASEVQYTSISEIEEAKAFFELKTGRSFEPTRSDSSAMAHFQVRGHGGCNTRSPDGRFQRGTNGAFVLYEKGKKEIQGYNVEHYDKGDH